MAGLLIGPSHWNVYYGFQFPVSCWTQGFRSLCLEGNALGLTPIHCIPSLPAQTSNNICVEYSFIGGPAVITLYRALTTSRSKARAEMLRRIGLTFGPVC